MKNSKQTTLKNKTKKTIEVKHMTTIRTDDELKEVFNEVGKGYEFEVKKAEFIPFADFKVTWEGNRGTREIKFKVSDYAMNMDKENIEVLAEMMFRRIDNKSVEGEYKDKFNKTILEENFSTMNRPFYIERKKLEKVPFKVYKGVYVHWSKVGMFNAGFISTLMKVIALNPELKNAPDDIVETVIKMQYNRIQDGILSFGGESKQVEIPCDELLKTKKWLVNNDLRLNEDLFN